jgi:hypothetical protein
LKLRKVLKGAAAAAAMLAGAPDPAAAAEPVDVNGAGSYIHSASGMTFPSAVGGFRQVEVRQYDATGKDVGVGYNLVSPEVQVVATVYVYPAPSLISIFSPPEVVADARAHLCQGEFTRRKQEILDAHPRARLIQEGEARPPGGRAPGHVASYEFESVFGHRLQPVGSQLYVFCYVGGKWAVEYRFTWPRDEAVDSAIAGFMAGLSWTIREP